MTADPDAWPITEKTMLAILVKYLREGLPIAVSEVAAQRLGQRSPAGHA